MCPAALQTDGEAVAAKASGAVSAGASQAEVACAEPSTAHQEASAVAVPAENAVFDSISRLQEASVADADAVAPDIDQGGHVAHAEPVSALADQRRGDVESVMPTVEATAVDHEDVQVDDVETPHDTQEPEGGLEQQATDDPMES